MRGGTVLHTISLRRSSISLPISDAVDIGTLQALEPLGGNCANRLAMALGIVDVLGREIRYVESLSRWSRFPPEYRKHYVARWLSLSSRGSDYLSVVLTKLESVALEVAQRPTVEELHGPMNHDVPDR